MKEPLLKNLKSEKGLMLVELLAVIVILAIVAAIAIPAIGNIIENSRIETEKADAMTMISAANLYFAENSTGEAIQTVSLDTLMSEGYTTSLGYLNNSYWVAEGKPSWICGNKEHGENRVDFKKATIKEIAESKNETVVGTSDCW